MKLNTTALMVMRHLSNFFISDANKPPPYYRRAGIFTIKDGNIALDGDFEPGDWIAITESRRNNGIYLLKEVPILEQDLNMPGFPFYRLSNGEDDALPTVDSKDFNAVIFRVQFAAGFLDLVKEIQVYEVNKPQGNVQKESAGVLGVKQWSVTYEDGEMAKWENKFSDRLAPFRRFGTGVRI